MQLDDRLRLPLSKLEARNQTFARFPWSAGRADERDHGIQVFDCFLKAEQKMLVVSRFAQQIIGAPPDNIGPVIEKALDDVNEPEFPIVEPAPGSRYSRIG